MISPAGTINPRTLPVYGYDLFASCRPGQCAVDDWTGELTIGSSIPLSQLYVFREFSLAQHLGDGFCHAEAHNRNKVDSARRHTSVRSRPGTICASVQPPTAPIRFPRRTASASGRIRRCPSTEPSSRYESCNAATRTSVRIISPHDVLYCSVQPANVLRGTVWLHWHQS